MTRWVAVWCAIGMGGTAWAAPVARQYSADMVMEAEGQTITMRAYMDEGKARSEMEMPSLPGQQTASPRVVTIVRPDRQKLSVLYPDSQVYEEKRLDTRDVQFSVASAPGAAMEDRGTETVHGIACTNESQSMWAWASQADGLPVKMPSVDGRTVIQLKHVQWGPQPAALFEIPAGYQQGTGLVGISALLKGRLPDAGVDDKGQTPADEIPPEIMEQVQKLMNRSGPIETKGGRLRAVTEASLFVWKALCEAWPFPCAHWLTLPLWEQDPVLKPPFAG